jgi:hypothetical protein
MSKRVFAPIMGSLVLREGGVDSEARNLQGVGPEVQNLLRV